MTAVEFKNRHSIKFPHEIGKPLYIQDVDVKKEFINSLPIKVVTLIFFLIIARIVVLASYGSFVHEHFEFTLFNTLFSLVAGLAIFAVFVLMIKRFFDVDLVVVGDKGIVTYTFWPNGKLKSDKIILWSQDMELKTTYFEGYYGRALPMFKPDYYKIEYTLHQEEERIISFKYDTKPKPRDTKKEIADAAKHSFEVFQITRKHHG